MGILSSSREMKTQLYFRDDNKFEFIRRRVEFSCLVEKKGEEILRGWKHFYSNQFFFPGYKKMPADTVALGFARDIILDPFDKIPKGEALNEKPRTKDLLGLKKWIAKIATNQRHIYQVKKKSTIKEDIINHVLLVVLGLMIAGWIIRFLSS